MASYQPARQCPFDIFAHAPERKLERRLIADYEATLVTLLAGLGRDNHAIAREIAALPETIRGFGPIKELNLEKAKAERPTSSTPTAAPPRRPPPPSSRAQWRRRVAARSRSPAETN